MCLRPPHHKEFKGLGSKGLPLFMENSEDPFPLLIYGINLYF